MKYDCCMFYVLCNFISLLWYWMKVLSWCCFDVLLCFTSPVKSDFIRAKYQMLAFVNRQKDSELSSAEDLSKVRDLVLMQYNYSTRWSLVCKVIVFKEIHLPLLNILFSHATIHLRLLNILFSRATIHLQLFYVAELNVICVKVRHSKWNSLFWQKIPRSHFLSDYNSCMCLQSLVIVMWSSDVTCLGLDSGGET